MKRSDHVGWLLAASLAGALFSAVGAQTVCHEEQKLRPSDPGQGDVFGTSVSIGGDRAIIGAPFDDDNGADSGSAYVFRRSGGAWMEEGKLLASDGAVEDNFGSSVSISGDVAIIGAPDDDNNGMNNPTGSAYVFRYDADLEVWVEEQPKLLASDGEAGDLFGFSVSISGDVAIVGAYDDDDNGLDAGSAYIFRYDHELGSWTEEQKLAASDPGTLDSFGYWVSISGDVAIIGAPFDDDNGSDSGSAYVFRYDADQGLWAEETKLLAWNGAASDQFGRAVSISGEVAIVGAPFDDDNGSSSGSAHVYRYDRDSGLWMEEQPSLLASDGAGGDWFGRAVSLSGNTAIVGARRNDHDGMNNTGAAYVFEYDGVAWSEQQQLLASDGVAGDQLGWSVSISGNAAIAGATGDADNGPATGSVYAFDLASCGCPADTNNDGGVDVQDLVRIILAWGIVDDEDGQAADVNDDGQVDVQDLVVLILEWGPCP